MTLQGTVEAATLEGADASLLVQQLDKHLALAYSMKTAARVRFDAILSAVEALRDLAMFAFVGLHLFSVGRLH